MLGSSDKRPVRRITSACLSFAAVKQRGWTTKTEPPSENYKPEIVHNWQPFTQMFWKVRDTSQSGRTAWDKYQKHIWGKYKHLKVKQRQVEGRGRLCTEQAAKEKNRWKRRVNGLNFGVNDKSCGGFSLLKGLINGLMGSWSSEWVEKSTGLSLLATDLMDSAGTQQSKKKKLNTNVSGSKGKDGKTGGRD